MQGKHILVVDDDPKIRALLRSCFEGEGACVHEATDAASVARFFEGTRPDLVTLDLGLGHEDGFDIARTIRKTHDTPIIMLTGKDDVIDRIVGLELGADDYVTKPFHVREMIARAKAVLRRYDAPNEGHAETTTSYDPSEDSMMLDGLLLDFGRMTVRDRNGEDCELTTADFKLMKAFVEHSGRPLSRDRLMDLINGPEWVPLDRTIDNQVARLRKKIERDPARAKLIKTVRGIGYMLTEAAVPSDQSSANKA